MSNGTSAASIVRRQRSSSRGCDSRPCDVRITLLTAGDLPLKIDSERPDMVGIDRLLGAVAVNAMRPAHRPAVVIYFGTAITVDLVSPEGTFQGGAILPGIGMLARAFHDLLISCR